MPKFDPNEYEPVEERLARALEKHEDLRIITECVKAGEDKKWLFKASIYLTAGDQAAGLPKATGWASELEEGPQAHFKAELGETSSIGRALANFGFTGNRKSQTARPTREEMTKANREPQKTDWIAEATKLKTVPELRKLYTRASANGATTDELDQIRSHADARSTTGQPKRVG